MLIDVDSTSGPVCESVDGQRISIDYSNVTLMNTLAKIKSKSRAQRITISALLMIAGALGICWAGFRYASAASEANRKFAFLDEFSKDKQELEDRLSELNRKAAEKNQSRPVEQTVPKKPTVETEEKRYLDRQEDFYSAPLKIDLSNAAIEKRIERDATYLSSDELEGRGIRTRGLELAGEYLAEEFEKAGLYTSWYGGGPFQEFQLLNGSRRGAVQRVLFQRKSGERYLLTPNVDFTSLMRTTMGTMTLPAVFVGYGITAPELGYDDYANVRVAGKTVIILRQEPQSSKPSGPFSGSEGTRYAPVYSKIQNAISHGATAVILCDKDPRVEIPKGDDPFSSDLLKVEFSEDAFDTTIPVVHCRQSLLDEVLQDYGLDPLLEIERKIDEDLTPRSVEIEGFRVGFEVTRNRSGRNVRNVLASIEPNGKLPEKTIIIGAHYDHLGRDGWGSLAVGADGEIHNGADDNASGTATILEIARQLSARRDKLKSRILFIAFTAEELGLLGSKHYIRDPAVPLSETVAMINLDMVGRLREQLTIYGMGTASEWDELVIPAARQNELTVVAKSSGYGPSDHAVFYERGVPVLHFFTGFHPQYHRPADDSNLLNITGMRQISRCVTEIAASLASNKDPLSPGDAVSDELFAEGGFKEILESTPAKPPAFGVVVRPMEPGSTGLLIRRVLANSVAENNGLKEGDVIRKVGETDIETVQDLKDSVAEQQSGAKLPIRISRGTIDLEIDVVF